MFRPQPHRSARLAPGLALGLALVVTAACAPSSPPEVSNAEAVAQALTAPARAADQPADARRHPAELVGLSGLHEGQRVLDLIPGGGYWTRIFSGVVGPQGRVYSVWPKAYADQQSHSVQLLRDAAGAAPWANVAVLVQPTTDLTAPEPVDVVWTSQNYHDYNDPFMGSPGSRTLAAAAFRALKPGGVFIVIDHASAPGRGLADTEALHRIDPGAVRSEALAAGFEFAGESKVLANPADPLNIPVFDSAIRGHTSQFALKFRKPMG